MSILFKDLINRGSAVVFIDDVLLMSKFEPYMLQLVKQPHDTASEANLKLYRDKSFFMLFAVEDLGHELDFNTIKPINSKEAAIYKNPSQLQKLNW